MSRLADDSDPLLAFSNEPSGGPPDASPSDPATQPVATTEDARRPLRAPAVDPLIARVDRLERALEDSKKQVSTLKSEVATLVRALGDIKKPTSRPDATPRSGVRTVAAAVGIVIGLGFGILTWVYLTPDADTTIAAPAPVSTQGLVADPTPAVRGPTVSEGPKTSAPVALAALKASQTPQASEAPRYVGTLSIDSSPGGEVFLDRQSAGLTPLRLTNLRAGSHLIWIERDGYRRFTRVVQVPSGRVTRLSAELEPIPVR